MGTRFFEFINLHRIVVILETESDVVIVLVGEGTLRNLADIVLIRDILLK